MMNYTFKALSGKVVTVRACDMNQARILATAYHGKEFLRADLIKATSAL